MKTKLSSNYELPFYILFKIFKQPKINHTFKSMDLIVEINRYQSFFTSSSDLRQKI